MARLISPTPRPRRTLVNYVFISFQNFNQKLQFWKRSGEQWSTKTEQLIIENLEFKPTEVHIKNADREWLQKHYPDVN